jgi:predicted PurR-regulated permease PerM
MSFMGSLPTAGVKKTSSLTVIQYVVLVSLILYFGREIFVPLAFAVLISFVLYPVCAWMEKKGIGRMTAIGISVTSMTMILLLVALLLASQIINFVQEWDDLQPKMSSAFMQWKESVITYFGITQIQLDQWLSKGIEQAFASSIKFIGGTISVSAASLVFAVLVPVYVVLILYYRNLWKEVLFRLLPEESHERINTMLSLTIQAYYNFIKGMGIVYLVVGLLNSLGLFFLGVPHAFLFGFVASVLTFIPYVGIMVGALIPVTIAWATNDSIWYPVGVIGVFSFVQYLEANVIFPFAVSSRLKVNTLAVLFAIFAGGLLWGVSGMILFVPFVGIIKLIADNDPRLTTISLALGTGAAKKNGSQ